MTTKTSLVSSAALFAASSAIKGFDTETLLAAMALNSAKQGKVDVDAFNQQLADSISVAVDSAQIKLTEDHRVQLYTKLYALQLFASDHKTGHNAGNMALQIADSLRQLKLVSGDLVEVKDRVQDALKSLTVQAEAEKFDGQTLKGADGKVIRKIVADGDDRIFVTNKRVGTQLKQQYQNAQAYAKLVQDASDAVDAFVVAQEEQTEVETETASEDNPAGELELDNHIHIR